MRNCSVARLTDSDRDISCHRPGRPAAGAKSASKQSGLVLRQEDPDNQDNFSSAEEAEWHASNNNNSDPSGYTNEYQPYGEHVGQYALQAYGHGEHIDQYAEQEYAKTYEGGESHHQGGG